MTKCCVDANIAVKWIIDDEPFCSVALTFFMDTKLKGIEFIAPPVFPSEVDSVIRKRVFHKKMSIDEAHKAYRLLDQIPVIIYDVSDVRQRSRDIAEKFNQRSVYDATYAALAELHNCEFCTADKVFYDAVKSDLKYVRYFQITHNWLYGKVEYQKHGNFGKYENVTTL